MKTKMIQSNREIIILLAIIFSLCVAVRPVLSEEKLFKQGAIISIETIDKRIFTGELVKVMRCSLQIYIMNTEKKLSINIIDIKIIRIKKNSYGAKKIGTILGAIFGGVAGGVLLNEPIRTVLPEDVFGFEGDGYKTTVAPLIGISAGCLIGAGFGKRMGTVVTEKNIQIEGESQKKIEAALKYLRSKERKEYE